MAAAFRLRTIFVLACALIAVGVAMIAGGRLQAGAVVDRDAELKLTALRLDLAQVSDLPWRASRQDGDDPVATRRDLQAAQARIERTIAQLEEAGDAADVRALHVSVARGMEALWDIFDHVRDGRGDEAHESSRRAAHELTNADVALRRAASHYHHDAADALTQARLQWISVILLLFVAFAWCYARVAKARDTAERLAEENRHLLAVTRKEALTDALTGLGNRRALVTALDAARPGAGERLMLAMFDLNGFKQYNDRFGHPAGDALLARMGARLAATMASIGSAYRMGGDEFCIVAHVAEGDEEALAIRAAVALSEHGDGFTIECAHGIAVMPDDTCAPNVALRLADQRMYEHKATFVLDLLEAPGPLPRPAPATPAPCPKPDSRPAIDVAPMTAAGR